MDLGIFIPIGHNGWMISATSPLYMLSFALNRAIAAQAEAYGFNFLLSMVKLRGFGGRTEFWDHNLESFTLDNISIGRSGINIVSEWNKPE